MISVWIHSFNKQFNLIITWTTNNKIIVSSTIGKQLLLHLVIILVISYVHTFISIQRQTRARICHVAYEFSILEAVRTFNLPTTLTAAFARRKKIRWDPRVLSTNKHTAFFSFEIFCASLSWYFRKPF